MHTGFLFCFCFATQEVRRNWKLASTSDFLIQGAWCLRTRPWDSASAVVQSRPCSAQELIVCSATSQPGNPQEPSACFLSLMHERPDHPTVPALCGHRLRLCCAKTMLEQRDSPSQVVISDSDIGLKSNYSHIIQTTENKPQGNNQSWKLPFWFCTSSIL